MKVFFLFFIMMSVQHDPIRGCIYGRLNLDEFIIQVAAKLWNTILILPKQVHYLRIA